MIIYVYKATSPSNKCYIGISNDYKKRWNDHACDALNKNADDYNTHFKRAIRKHNDELKWEIIDSAKDYNTAHELERRYILQFDSYKNGYNMTKGGDGNVSDHSPYRWTKSLIKLAAKKYVCKPDWNEFNRNSYLAARRFDKVHPGFFNECIAHMKEIKKRNKPHNFKWTKEAVKIKAKKYKRKIDFKTNCSPAYAALNIYKKEDQSFYNYCTSHMK